MGTNVHCVSIARLRLVVKHGLYRSGGYVAASPRGGWLKVRVC